MFVGLGGNTSQTRASFRDARSFLGTILDQARFSSLYRTSPLLDTDQDDFWNAVVLGQWAGTPEGLLERLLMFEASRGRVRDPLRPKGPRVLDLDLLVFGDEVRVSPRLTVPHPGLSERLFALLPLLELEPEAVDPQDRVPWASKCALLVSQLGDHGGDQGVDRTGGTW